MLLFNPFHYFAGFKAMITGIAIILVTGYIAFLSNSRFDGLINFHTLVPLTPVLNCLLDGLISWLIISLLLLIAGKIISKSRFRIVDVIGTQALARFPFLLLALLPMIPGIVMGTISYEQKLFLSKGITDLISVYLIPFIVLYGMSILMTVWMITLMYRAFSVSCNVSGKKALFGFGICFIIGVIISSSVIKRIPPIPENQTQVEAQKVDFESVVHEIFTLCAENKFIEAMAMADDNFKSSYSLELIKAGWADAISRFGPYKKHGQVLISEKMNYTVCDVICYFEKGWIHYRWRFNNNGKLSSFTVR